MLLSSLWRLFRLRKNLWLETGELEQQVHNWIFFYARTKKNYSIWSGPDPTWKTD